MYNDKEDKVTNSGLVSRFHSILSNERPHNQGYEKLETDDPRNDRIIMNTHSPMNWMTKHYVQRPTPFDALEGLIDSGRPKNIILPPSRIFEDNIQGFMKYTNQIDTGSSRIGKGHLSYC